MARLVVEQRRGKAVESEHPIEGVLCRSDGTVVERVGDGMVTTWRSAAKPFQLVGSLSQLDDSLVNGLSDAELAAGAASHSAQVGHTDQVVALMQHLGLGLSQLFCGAHWPMNEGATHALIREKLPLTALHNNCSGKHSFMAAAAAAQGWSPDYRAVEHPLQRVIRAVVDEATGNAVSSAVVDGCGVPCFVLPIDGMARAWAMLAEATQRGEGRLGRVGRAMLSEPWFVSGDERLDLALSRAATAPLISKVGAQALLNLALVEQGLGAALKVRTGDEPARAVAVEALLARWLPGLLPPAAVAPWRVVRNVVGEPVGERVAVWRS